MQLRSKTVDLEPLLISVRKSNEPLTREEISQRSGLTYNQLRKQLPQLIQTGEITWSSERNDRGHEIRRYWVPTVAAMLLVLPGIVGLPSASIGPTSRIAQAA